jgi:hypothetical protein
MIESGGVWIVALDGTHLLKPRGVGRDRVRVAGGGRSEGDGVEVAVAPLELLHRCGEVCHRARVRHEARHRTFIERHTLRGRREEDEWSRQQMH